MKTSRLDMVIEWLIELLYKDRVRICWRNEQEVNGTTSQELFGSDMGEWMAWSETKLSCSRKLFIFFQIFRPVRGQLTLDWDWRIRKTEKVVNQYGKKVKEKTSLRLEYSPWSLRMSTSTNLGKFLRSTTFSTSSRNFGRAAGFPSMKAIRSFLSGTILTPSTSYPALTLLVFGGGGTEAHSILQSKDVLSILPEEDTFLPAIQRCGSSSPIAWTRRGFLVDFDLRKPELRTLRSKEWSPKKETALLSPPSAPTPLEEGIPGETPCFLSTWFQCWDVWESERCLEALFSRTKRTVFHRWRERSGCWRGIQRRGSEAPLCHKSRSPSSPILFLLPPLCWRCWSLELSCRI